MSSSSEEETSSGGDGGGVWPVTEEWLLTVLKEHHGDAASNVNIIDFKVNTGCDAKENVLSDILAVKVRYYLKENDDEAELSFIVKLLPQDPFSRFFVTEAQFDLREIKFYTQVVPDLEAFMSRHLSAPLPLPIPRCYHAHYSPSTPTAPPESVLVLSNLKPLGYVSADYRRGLTLRQCSAAIEAIATVHALGLCLKSENATRLDERYPFLFQTARASDSYQQLVERGLPQLATFLEKRTGLVEILAALNDLKPHTKVIIEKLLEPEEPMALITHTDFWCNNLMFNEAGQCAILDWQMVTYSRPTNDVALLLVSSVPAEVRRLHTEHLLDEYWTKLTETCRLFGVEMEEYDRKKLGEDYKKSQLLALLLCIGSVDLALGNEEMEERLLTLLQDLHEEGLLDVGVVQ